MRPVKLASVSRVSSTGTEMCREDVRMTDLVRKLRRCMNSQWSASSTLTTPQRFLRPRTDLPSIITLFSEPTTAKGMICCKGESNLVSGSKRGEGTDPNRLVELDLLFVILISVERIQTNVVVDQLVPDLK